MMHVLAIILAALVAIVTVSFAWHKTTEERREKILYWHVTAWYVTGVLAVIAVCVMFALCLTDAGHDIPWLAWVEC